MQHVNLNLNTRREHFEPRHRSAIDSASGLPALPGLQLSQPACSVAATWQWLAKLQRKARPWLPKLA